MTVIRNSSVSALYGHSLGDVLRRTATRVPNKTAIVCGQVTWTYREFDSICNRLANGLTARGIAPGDRVAVLSRNSHMFAAFRFALARIGAVLVPVNFMLNAEEIAFILRSSGAQTLALSSDFIEVGGEASSRVSAVTQLYWLASGDAPAADPARMVRFDAILSDSAEAPQIAVDARVLAQIVNTSGTESLPKGVMLTHEAILWEYVSCIIDAEISESDVILHALPMYHCAQLDCFFGPASMSAPPTSSSDSLAPTWSCR